MSTPKRNTVSDEQWDEAAAAYELGHKHAAEIARELGVSAATVSREFKRRGCRKGCRVMEVVAELEAKLDAEERERDHLREQKTAVIDRLVADLVDAIIAADKAGNLTIANPEIARIDKALEMATL